MVDREKQEINWRYGGRKIFLHSLNEKLNARLQELSIDITDEVRTQAGIPVFNSLKLEMKDVICRYFEIIGLIEGDEE